MEITSLEHAYQWTHDGEECLIVKCVGNDGSSYNGFKWPLTVGATVEPESWDPKAECGNGLHGWPWGLCIGDGKEPDWVGKWIVFGSKPEDIVNLGGKCKSKQGVIRFVGDWVGATRFVLSGQMALVALVSKDSSATGDRSASSATGDRSASSATGDRSASSATGDRSASSATGDNSASSATGDRSASSATGYNSASSATGDSSASSATGYNSASSATGYRSASSATGDNSASSATGDRSASSATGDRSASSATGYNSASSATGDRSASFVTGLYGRARAGKYGCVGLAWWNAKESMGEMRCREIGCGDGSDGKLKANVWYYLDENGDFKECLPGSV